MESLNVFLTGERGVGKSTAIARFAATLDFTPAGFRTFPLPLEGAGRDCVCIAAYGAPPGDLAVPGQGNGVVAIRNRDAFKMEVFPAAFDTVGARVLREGRSSGARLVVMDELGFMESGAAAFQEEVRLCLGADVPVLGVLKKALPPGGFGGGNARTAFLESVRARGDVRVLEVTEANREKIFRQLCEMF
ncbi:MAG: nucleoside-triphosphatase [Clostridiales Family XIII bacterium]|jgi:nucleoside-triphosphatase|nr:nucleoside-triphosphatase [Clostridiales Family XIII bacterium]